MTESLVKTNTHTAKASITLIHGWGLNHAIWQPLADKLSSEYEVVCVDLPGFGAKAEQSFNTYEFETIADSLLSEIPEQTILIGWSLGGLIASYIALKHPTKVAKLVTVASTPFFVEQENWPGIKPLVLKSFHKQLSQDGQKTIDAFLKIQAMGSPHLRHDIKVIRDLVMTLPQPSQSTLDQSLSLLETVDLRQHIGNIKQPFLRLYGEMDSLVPKAVIQQINELTPNSENHTFNKASHAPFISHESEFLNHLIGWISAN